MKVSQLNFCGTKLAVIIGHPDFELLFVASQVAAAAGLEGTAPTNTLKAGNANGCRIKDLKRLDINLTSSLKDSKGRKLSPLAWLFDEPTVYKMLLRGHAPQSESFRKWVTEEVLTSIRKTGSYDVTTSETEEGKALAAEFGLLRAEIQRLGAEVKSLANVIAELKSLPSAGPAIVVSPYEGDIKRAVCTQFDRKCYLDVGDSMGMSVVILDKVSSIAAIRAEHKARALWDAEDGRPLSSKVSMKGRDWTLFPEKWLKSKMDRQFYREVINMAIEASMNVINK